MLDALGPKWSYYDDWLHMAKILREDRHVSKGEADEMRGRCRHKLTIGPTGQGDLDLTAFNITDGSWVRSIREQVS